MYNIYINNTSRCENVRNRVRFPTGIINYEFSLAIEKLVNRHRFVKHSRILIYRKAAGNVDDYVYNM